MKHTDTDHRHAVALFRYGLIADLVHLAPGTKGLYRRLEQKAAEHYFIPGTSRTRVATETLRDWLKRYRKGGFEALMPNVRADRGRPPGTASGGGRCTAIDQGGESDVVRAPGHRAGPWPVGRFPPNCRCRPPPCIGCSCAMA